MLSQAIVIFIAICTLIFTANAGSTFLPAAEIAKLNTSNMTNFNT